MIDQPDKKPPVPADDADYDVEIVGEPPIATDPTDPETIHIEKEGDPFGDNFA